jgi:anti-anti-sigma regulatory factor
VPDDVIPEFECRIDMRTGCVELRGQLSQRVSQHLDTLFELTAASARPCWHFDLSALTSCDAAGLASLLTLQRASAGRHLEVLLFGARPGLRDVMTRSGLKLLSDVDVARRRPAPGPPPRRRGDDVGSGSGSGGRTARPSRAETSSRRPLVEVSSRDSVTVPVPDPAQAPPSPAGSRLTGSGRRCSVNNCSRDGVITVHAFCLCAEHHERLLTGERMALRQERHEAPVSSLVRPDDPHGAA